ncbi:MAG: manganese efflux pump [Clostridiales bacterium]|nr:manganese efflux pump [Clostridiales bacterium]
MHADGIFYANSILLGIGLAVDAFIIALSNGMNGIGRKKCLTAAILLAVFQFSAVMSGWAVAYTTYAYCGWIKKVFSWIAAIVFLFMSVKMFVSAARNNNATAGEQCGILSLVIQCGAASTDALTVGFTIEEYGYVSAIICSGLIAAVTFSVYVAGHIIGKHFGVKLGRAASVIGGLAFIAIAVDIIIGAI